MGRAKIEIKRINNPNKRNVTYSKRCPGFIKKGYELSVLSATDMLVITRHPSDGKLCYLSHSKRAEDILIRYLNMPDDDRKVKDRNGHETRLVIPNKDSLIAKLQNCKIQEDEMAAAEKISTEQVNSGPITSGDDNQFNQHPEVINPQDFPQEILDNQLIQNTDELINYQNELFRQWLLDYKRFIQTATPMTPEEEFDVYEKKLKDMLSLIEQSHRYAESMRINSMRAGPSSSHQMIQPPEMTLSQQQQQSIMMQTNAGFVNNQPQQRQGISIHGQQGLAALHDLKNKGKAVIEQNPPSIHMQQFQGRAINMQLPQQVEGGSRNMQWPQQFQGGAYNMHWQQQFQGRAHNMQLQQQAQGRPRNMQPQQQRASLYQKNNGNMLLSTEGSLQAPFPNSLVTQQEQGRSSLNNGHINPTDEQYFNQMGFPTGLDVKENNYGLMQSRAPSSHVITGSYPMLSPNTSWGSTSHTTGPSHYFHKQPFEERGHDANYMLEFGQQNDNPM